MKKFLLTVAALALLACPASAETYKFRIHNDTDFPFTKIHIVPPGTDGWGPNLATPPLKPGKYRTFTVNSCNVKFGMGGPTEGLGGSIEDFDICAEPDFYFVGSNLFGD